MANGGWASAASDIVVRVGFPVVVAAVLLWFLLTEFTKDMGQISLRMSENAVAIEKFTAMQNDQLTEMKAHTQELREQTAMMKAWVAAKKRGEYGLQDPQR